MDQGANMFHNRYVTGNCTGIIHVVKEGDTLYKIGKMHGVSVSALMYANPYVNIYNLQVGDELCVPVYNMPWNTGKEPQSGGSMQRPQNMQGRENMQQPQNMQGRENMQQPQNMQGRENMQQPQNMQGRESMQQPQNMQDRENMQRPQNMQSGENMRRQQSQETVENTAAEQGVPEVMRMQESRLEYEIMDDSEL